MSSPSKKITYKFSITNLVLVNEVYPFDFFLRIKCVNSQQSQDSPIIEANKMQCDQVFPWEFAVNQFLLRVQFVQITKNTRVEILRAHFNVNAITDEDGQTVAMLANRSSKKLCIVTYKLEPYTQIKKSNKQKIKEKPEKYHEESEELQRIQESESKTKNKPVIFSKQQHQQLTKQIAQINKSIDKILENQKTQHALFNKYLDQSTSFIKQIMNSSRAIRQPDSENQNENEDESKIKNNKGGSTNNILKQIQQQSQRHLQSINNSDIIKPVQNQNNNQNQIYEVKQPEQSKNHQSTSTNWYQIKFNKRRPQKIAKNVNYRKQNLTLSQTSQGSQIPDFSLQYTKENSSAIRSIFISDLSVNSSVKPKQIKFYQFQSQNSTIKKQVQENLILILKSNSNYCYDWKKSFQLPFNDCIVVGITGKSNQSNEKQMKLVGCISNKQLQRGKASLFDNKGDQKGYIRFNYKIVNTFSVQTHQLLDLSKLSRDHDQDKVQMKEQIQNNQKIQVQIESNKNNVDNLKDQIENNRPNSKKNSTVDLKVEDNNDNQESEVLKKDQIHIKENSEIKQLDKQQRYQLSPKTQKNIKSPLRKRRLSIDKGRHKQKERQKKNIQKQELENKQQALQSQQQIKQRRNKQIQKQRSKQKFKLYKVVYQNNQKQNRYNNQKQKQIKEQKQKSKELEKEKQREEQKQKQKQREEERQKDKEKEKQKEIEEQKQKEKLFQQNIQKQKNDMLQKGQKNKNKYNLVSNSVSVSFLPIKKHTVSQQSMHRRTPFLSDQQISSINSSQFVSKIKTVNLKIDSISAKLLKNPNQFAGKFIKLSIRNKNPFITQTINLSQNLIWQCKGCIFDSVSPYAQLMVQLCSDQNNKPKTIGKAKVCLALLNMQKENKVQFYHEFLRDQNENQIGQLIIGYDNIEKTRRVLSGKKSVNNQNHQNSAPHQDDGFLEQDQNNLSLIEQGNALQKKRKSKSKTKSKSKRKAHPQDNTNRTEKKNSNNIGMEGSRANILGSSSAIRAKKYTGGNIIIGRAARFRHGTEQKPGPGEYQMPSTFQRHTGNS